ncbi:MAG: alpha/beta hydrolase [Kurthia sp.]|nr:alpha/beta hydrolase [Candidatus Kurthia equi]
MNYSKPKTFSFAGGKRAVLLLHSFTGSTIDMRKLGKYLHANGYTSYSPMYTGHGEEATILLQYGPEQWWEDVRTAYEHLEDEGYEEIAVIGLSLGSILALKVANELNPIGVVTMSLPMAREEVTLRKRVIYYARNHQQYEDKTAEQKEWEITQLKEHPMPAIPEFVQLINEQVAKIPEISVPIFAMCGDLDDPLYRQSAEKIVETVGSSKKEMKVYKQAGHLMTFGTDAPIIFQDILTFLNELEWSD